ncbi:unnamed protein product [Linum trigynum]|uniref:Uncharacterized protein n=1 Tax=Linum trigynum TaxID=586398 RepID=A0AAV2GL27_9ROSI
MASEVHSILVILNDLPWGKPVMESSKRLEEGATTTKRELVPKPFVVGEKALEAVETMEELTSSIAATMPVSPHALAGSFETEEEEVVDLIKVALLTSHKSTVVAAATRPVAVKELTLAPVPLLVEDGDKDQGIVGIRSPVHPCIGPSMGGLVGVLLYGVGRSLLRRGKQMEWLQQAYTFHEEHGISLGSYLGVEMATMLHGLADYSNSNWEQLSYTNVGMRVSFGRFQCVDPGGENLERIEAANHGGIDWVLKVNWKYRKRDCHRPNLTIVHHKLRGSFFFIDPG